MNEDASPLVNWVIFRCWLVVEPTHLKNMIVKFADPLAKTNIAGWNISIFNKKYIDSFRIPGPAIPASYVSLPACHPIFLQVKSLSGKGITAPNTWLLQKRMRLHLVTHLGFFRINRRFFRDSVTGGLVGKSFVHRFFWGWGKRNQQKLVEKHL